MNVMKIKRILLAAGIENASFEALLLEEKFEGEALASAVERRCEGYPLQYLLGEWGFFRETYEVNECCLIPRADTETLVERAVALLPPEAAFLDLCTGSGCVAVSTLAARSDTRAAAVDLYEDTLALARRNAARNGVADRVEFCRADVLKPPPPELRTWGDGCGFSAILANPPYVTDAAMETLQREVRHEPRAALAGGADGLDFYRAILEKWRGTLTCGGFFLFEIGYDQAASLRALAARYDYHAEITRDLGGNDRVAALFPA